MTTTTFTVTGMSCGGCENSVRTAVSPINGVTDVTVSAHTGELTITSTQPIDQQTIITAVADAGFTATAR